CREIVAQDVLEQADRLLPDNIRKLGCIQVAPAHRSFAEESAILLGLLEDCLSVALGQVPGFDEVVAETMRWQVRRRRLDHAFAIEDFHAVSIAREGEHSAPAAVVDYADLI